MNGTPPVNDEELLLEEEKLDEELLEEDELKLGGDTLELIELTELRELEDEDELELIELTILENEEQLDLGTAETDDIEIAELREITGRNALVFVEVEDAPFGKKAAIAAEDELETKDVEVPVAPTVETTLPDSQFSDGYSLV